MCQDKFGQICDWFKKLLEMEYYQPQKRTRERCCLCPRTNLMTWVGIICDQLYIKLYIQFYNFCFLFTFIEGSLIALLVQAIYWHHPIQIQNNKMTTKLKVQCSVDSSSDLNDLPNSFPNQMQFLQIIVAPNTYPVP